MEEWGVPQLPQILYRVEAQVRLVGTHVAVLVFHDNSIDISHPFLPFPFDSRSSPPSHTCPTCATTSTSLSSMLGFSSTLIFFQQTFVGLDHRFLHCFIHCFDVPRLQWRSVPSTPPPLSRSIGLTMFQCTVADGTYVYFAGGAQRSSLHDRWHGLRSSYRMDVDTGTWDVLPDMHSKRANAAMVVIEGCVYVIGGETYEKDMHEGMANSGEIWDPSEGGEWTLVPELWPMEVFRKQPPKVVVVSDTLFAIRTSSDISEEQHEELMHYQSDTKVWNSLGPIASPSRHCTLCGPWTCHKLFAIGKQIWVLLVSFCRDERQTDHKRITMCTMACKPLRPHPVQWSHLPTMVPRDCEILPKFVAFIYV